MKLVNFITDIDWWQVTVKSYPVYPQLNDSEKIHCLSRSDLTRIPRARPKMPHCKQGQFCSSFVLHTETQQFLTGPNAVRILWLKIFFFSKKTYVGPMQSNTKMLHVSRFVRNGLSLLRNLKSFSAKSKIYGKYIKIRKTISAYEESSLKNLPEMPYKNIECTISVSF